jgi:membrane-bound lytic murein transglycosylase A
MIRSWRNVFAPLWLMVLVMMSNACNAEAERYIWQRADWKSLPAFDSAQATAGLRAWQKSCTRINTPNVRIFDRTVSAEVMLELCKRAANASDAKTFFMQHFDVYSITTTQKEALHLTGYYVPLLKVSAVKTTEYNVPIYAKPTEQYRTTYSRKEIDAGALHGKAEIIAYGADAIDVFFLHIQGSGYAEYPDGTRALLRFAAKNDHPYTAIGAYFIEQQLATTQDMSLQWLKTWLHAHPDQASAIMQRNASFVYFELAAAHTDIIGAQATPLTPMHSVAIDPAYLDYGVPLYIHSDATSRFVITQDTGSAIKGRLRADLFAGAGQQAEQLAGRLNAQAELYALFPKHADYVQQ